MKRRLRVLFILVPIAFAALAIFITMTLWNWLMPALFGLGMLTFFKAAGVLLLAKILFGSRGHSRFGNHGPSRMSFAFIGMRHSHHYSGNREEWKQKMQERWQHLTPEQKEKFSGRCGKWFNNKTNAGSVNTETGTGN